MKANPGSRPLAYCAASVLSLLAACSAPPPAPAPAPSPTPRPSAAPLPPVVPARDWRDTAITPGDWRYYPNPGGGSAAFGTNLFQMICNRQAGTVTLVRAGALSGTVPMSVTTSSGSRPLAGEGDGMTVSVALPARDPLLDAMAFSRGRFAIDAAGLPSLYLPSWAEVSRVIEDCR